MRFYKKIVTTTTIFFAGVSGVFLLSGAGAPGLRVLVGLIFFISALNLSIYLREFAQWSQKVVQTAGGQLAAAGKTDKKPGGGADGKSGTPTKGQPSAEGGPRRQPDGGAGKSGDEAGNRE